MAKPGYVRSEFACGCLVKNDLYRFAIVSEENVKCSVVYLNKAIVEDPYMIPEALQLHFSSAKRQRLNIFLTCEFTWHESSAKSPSYCTIYTMTRTRNLPNTRWSWKPIMSGLSNKLWTGFCFSYLFVTLAIAISGCFYLNRQENMGRLYDCSGPVDVILSDVINIS